MNVNIPKRRFKGFTNDWEQRKGKEVFKVVSNKTDETLPVLSATQTKGMIPRDLIDLNIKYDKASVKNYKLVERNQFVVHLRSFQGGFAHSDYRGVTSPAYTVFDFLNVENHDPMFWKYYFFRKTFIQELVKVTYGIRDGRSISFKDYLSLKSNYPSKSEQTKIASLLFKLDALITLHKRKFEKLKQLQKSYLNESILSEPKCIPKRRFKGFVEPWEQCKFEKLLDYDDGIRRGPFGSALKKEYFVQNSDYVVYEQNNAISNHFKTRYKITEEKFKELHKFELLPGDFIMSGAGTIGRVSLVPPNISRGVINQALIRIRLNETTDSGYFLEWIMSPKMQRKLTESNPGSAMVNLVPMRELKNWKVRIPTVKEQIKISRLLNTLQKTISLHKHKHNAIKILQKIYLQNNLEDETYA